MTDDLNRHEHRYQTLRSRNSQPWH